ncbi:histidine phosphatase family protein [Dehalogenimonas sp. 4OHTPN]|uniref:phosphoglycerate mutase (2,3-diphosphoglycerate-dependent) n=1 Tax=Dehalogenimonas sp. 4OHTPN TaxID=3166643 RepID=A0AAU8G8P6_9CHLR
MKLILIRHGKTATDNPEKCHGSTDIDLSEEGYQQAARLANRFKDQQIDAMYASTLRRGAATAGTIAAAHNIDVVSAPELNEVDFGRIEGITFEEACGLYPDVTELWRCGSTQLCFPAGETFTDFAARVNSFLPRLQAHRDDETIMLVGHGGPYKVLVCSLLGLPMEHYWKFRFDMASVSIIDIYPTGAMLGKLSDTSHLV